MIKPETLKALRVIALAEADQKTYNAWYKSICRWYSEKFHTKLMEVLDYSEVHVLTTYFEDVFWTLKKQADGSLDAEDDSAYLRYEQLVQDCLIDGDAVSQVEMEEIESEDDDWYEQELANFEKTLNKQDRDITKKMAKTGSDGILIDKPNLPIEPTTRFVDGEDDIFPDDDEGP